ncbi:hypothetical protein OEA41_001393 [Lepraria neglecta]|uniref:Uncharacterized protein n=1 Tax=Lepraria neglecta TaxID=209136 RepID=A0AAE0DLC1_9LECA|nr:hypothetical protein OEA41_001393 [Lepraria neglecta]
MSRHSFFEQNSSLLRNGNATGIVELELNERHRESAASSSARLARAETLPPFDKASGTRLACIAGIGASYIIALVCLAGSIYLHIQNADTGSSYFQIRTWTMRVPLASAPRIILNLILNIAVTLCTECLGYVHYTSLRWALWSEATYTAASQVLLDDFDYGEAEVNGVALLVLGIGLLVQALLAQACIMIKSKQILTWSSNVLTVTLACLHSPEELRHRDGRCMIPAAEASNHVDGPRRPSVHQPSLRETDASARHVIRFVWLLVPAAALWAVVLAAAWTNGLRFAFRSEASYITKDNISSHGYGLLIVGVCQTFITMGLHCVEILVNRSRDEVLWRQAASRKRKSRTPPQQKSSGAPKSYSSIAAAMTNVVPAAWGHLQTLADLIDDWGDGQVEKLYWGDKGQNSDGTRHAGTSNDVMAVGEIYLECQKRKRMQYQGTKSMRPRSRKLKRAGPTIVPRRMKQKLLGMIPEDESEREAQEADGDVDDAEETDCDDALSAQDSDAHSDPASTSTTTRALRKRNNPSLTSSQRADIVLSRSRGASDTAKKTDESKLEAKARRKLREDKRAVNEKGREKDLLGLERVDVDIGGVLEKEKQLRQTVNVKLYLY